MLSTSEVNLISEKIWVWVRGTEMSSRVRTKNGRVGGIRGPWAMKGKMLGLRNNGIIQRGFVEASFVPGDGMAGGRQFDRRCRSTEQLIELIVNVFHPLCTIKADFEQKYDEYRTEEERQTAKHHYDL
jgi:hypothetical protein